MIERLRRAVVPVRPKPGETGYRRVLRWVALPVTDRRWAAPLCALALGFGLFAGVAIGPGASGTLATGASQIIEIPGFNGGTNTGEDSGSEGGGPSAALISPAGGSSGSEGSTIPSSGSALPSFAPVPESAPESESTAAPEKSAPKSESPPSEEEPKPETVSGVVVHANPAAGSYAIVESGGVLSAIHAAKLPTPGARVSVPVRTLANGTFAEAGSRKKTGKQTRASFEGIVTFVDTDPSTPAYAVSKRGVSVLVHIRPDPAGVAPQLPVLGAYASVTVEIEKPQPEAGATPPAEVAAPTDAVAPLSAATCAPDPAKSPATPAPVAVLWQRQLDADGAPFASSDFEGVVMAVCPSEGTLLLSADDLREGGKDLLFTVPKSIETGKLKPGDSVAATAAIEAGGALKLTGLASDERIKGADDARAAQGDLASHKPK